MAKSRIAREKQSQVARWKSPAKKSIGEGELRGGKAQKGLAMERHSHEEQGQGSEWQPLSGGNALLSQGVERTRMAKEKH